MIKNMYVSAVVLCAGSGTRMGRVLKPFIKLGGITLFEMVLESFCSSKYIDEIVVVTNFEDKFREKALPFSEKYPKIKFTYTKGGKTRADSSFEGVKASCRKTDIVAVHDCARPFITAAQIDSLVEECSRTGASCACTATTDTIKYCNKDVGMVYTPERKYLLSIQTPQVFMKKVYIASYGVSKKDDVEFTDESSMVERAGFKVSYIDCGPQNMKLTTEYDVTMAKAIVSLRKQGKI
jgi:2-C-methyl-D-erythritol 4-phosphate cytidylyltransferase